MMKNTRLVLLTSVAFPLMLSGPPAFAQESGPLAPIVVAQADALAAAQAEVAAAQAALQEAQASGGDVAAAQARLDAALSALAEAEAAAQSAPPPAEEPPPPEEPAAPEAAEPPPPSEPPATPETPEPPAADQAPTLETPPPEQPAAPETEPPAAPPPVLEAPPADQPAPDLAPPPAEGQPESAPEAPPVEEPASPPPASAEPPPAEDPAAETPPAPEPGATQPGEQTAAPPTAESEGSAVESQLEAQGDQEAVDNLRVLRKKLRQEEASGEEAEADGAVDDNQAESDGGGNEEVRREGGDRDRDRDGHRDRRPDGEIVLDLGGRFIIKLGDQIVIRQDDEYESDRFLHRARDVEVEHFRGGYTRTTVTREDGTQIFTVRDQYGDIITRTRVDRRGRQVVLIDNRTFYHDGRPAYVRFEDELPPLRLEIPQEEYIVETSRADREAIRAALMAPPVEAVERPYAIEEIRTSERLRDKVRRVDLNTITFDFGSAAISPSQFEALAAVGQAIEDILAKSPDEVFLIEGHTDAVGSDNDNLVLSDRRAEAIAVALSSNFEIQPENLVTQGYGEQYLKVPTEEEERENRRVTVRRITELAAKG